MDVHELTTRMETLERQAARSRRVARLTMLAGLVAILVAALAPPDDVVEARRVRLLDETGRVGLELDAGALTLSGAPDAGGRHHRARLRASGLDVRLESDGRAERVLEVDTREVDLVDYAGERRAVLTPATIGLQRGIAGTPERPVAWARLSASGLSYEDAEGRLRAELGTPAPARDDGAVLVLYDAGGNAVWSAPR